MKVVEDILKVIKEIIENDDINLNQSLKEIGCNSITFVKLVVQIEEIYNIEFDDDVLMVDKFSSVDSLVKYIVQKIEN